MLSSILNGWWADRDGEVLILRFWMVTWQTHWPADPFWLSLCWSQSQRNHTVEILVVFICFGFAAIYVQIRFFSPVTVTDLMHHVIYSSKSMVLLFSLTTKSGKEINHIIIIKIITICVEEMQDGKHLEFQTQQSCWLLRVWHTIYTGFNTSCCNALQTWQT